MDSPITRAEHEEFRRRIEEWEKRQDKRIEMLEENTKTTQELAMSVHALAHDMKGMLEEQKDQGNRLDKLEKEPASTYKQLKMTIATAIISTIAGGLTTATIVLVSKYI